MLLGCIENALGCIGDRLRMLWRCIGNDMKMHLGCNTYIGDTLYQGCTKHAIERNCGILLESERLLDEFRGH